MLAIHMGKDKFLIWIRKASVFFLLTLYKYVRNLHAWGLSPLGSKFRLRKVKIVINRLLGAACKLNKRNKLNKHKACKNRVARRLEGFRFRKIIWNFRKIWQKYLTFHWFDQKIRKEAIEIFPSNSYRDKPTVNIRTQCVPNLFRKRKLLNKPVR